MPTRKAPAQQPFPVITRTPRRELAKRRLLYPDELRIADTRSLWTTKTGSDLVTKRARVETEGHMEWIDGNIGSKLTMEYPSVYLMGPKATGEVLRALGLTMISTTAECSESLEYTGAEQPSM